MTQIVEICFAGLVVGILVIIGLSDWKHRIIPNKAIVCLLVMRLVGGAAVMAGWIEDGPLAFSELGLQFFVSAGACIAFVLLDVYVRHRCQAGGIGAGDIKLIFAMGLLISPHHFLVFLLLGSLFGVVHALITVAVDHDSSFPFGPSLIMGFCCCALL